MSPVLEKRPTSTTTFTVKVEDQALPGTFRIVSVDIRRELYRVAAASIVIFDGDPAAQDFEASNDDLLAPGKEITIEGGYSNDETVLFKGIVTRQRIQVQGKRDSLLLVEAHDAAFRMTLARKSRYFTELTDSDCFEEIIGGHAGLTADVAATTAQHAEIVQYQASDWDFVVMRAEALGLYVLGDNGTLHIQKPDVLQQPALTLAFGGNVVDLDLTMDSRTQVESVKASAWDPANQEVLSSEADDVPVPDQGNLSAADLAEVSGVQSDEVGHSAALPQTTVDAWAQARLLKSRLARIVGTVRFQGNELAVPGAIVELTGMGDRFNGKAFVSGVRHQLGNGDWETVVQLGLRSQWHHDLFPASVTPAAGLTPAINGLHTGIVTQLEGDPAGEERILVRLPLISPGDNGVWSRIATLDAGKDRGTVFRPEIGDEVLVGFINDDPHHPVVVGMMHSSNKPAPLPASDDNHEKGLVTRSKMKLIFNDDTPSVLIETPKGKRVLIDDDAGEIKLEDENGNKVLLSKDGITLESAKDIVLKAAKDVKVEGLNVNVKASAQAALEGTGGAALKSSGSTEVKGSIVQIN